MDRKVIPIKQGSIFASREKIYPTLVRGTFNNLRVFTVIVTQIFYFLVPWIRYDDRQLLLFDVANRRFYIFTTTFFPDEFIYLAALLAMCAFGLFTWTTFAGRLWCGYSCPQTVYTEIFIWIERLIEGNRNRRIKLDKEGWTLSKISKKGFKNVVYIVFSLWTGFTFVSYFAGSYEFLDELLSFAARNWSVITMLLYGAVTYLMAGILREQMCIYMCPYARFQSVMFDGDTLIISYDRKRGEPRGARKRNVDQSSLGDCINCNVCVNVCPTGIDIRDGLQYECIGCAACVDGCNEVMRKLGRPEGLIRYTSENALANLYPERELWKKAKRPRVSMYGLLVMVVLVVTIIAMLQRQPFRGDVLRDRSVLARLVEDGKVENIYNLKMSTTLQGPVRLNIGVEGIEGARVSLINFQSDQILNDDGSVTLTLQSTELLSPTVSVSVRRDKLNAVSNKIKFVFSSPEHGIDLRAESTFLDLIN